MQYISSWCITGGANALAGTCDHFLNEGLPCTIIREGTVHCPHLITLSFVFWISFFFRFLHFLLQCTTVVSRLFDFFTYDQRNGIALYTDFRTPNDNGFNTEVCRQISKFVPAKPCLNIAVRECLIKYQPIHYQLSIISPALASSKNMNPGSTELNMDQCKQ